MKVALMRGLAPCHHTPKAALVSRSLANVAHHPTTERIQHGALLCGSSDTYAGTVQWQWRVDCKPVHLMNRPSKLPMTPG